MLPGGRLGPDAYAWIDRWGRVPDTELIDRREVTRDRTHLNGEEARRSLEGVARPRRA